MYTVKFSPRNTNDLAAIKSFVKSGFETRKQAIEWLVENHCCIACQRFYSFQTQQNSKYYPNNFIVFDCMNDWEIFATAEPINLKELPEFSVEIGKLFIDRLRSVGVSEEQIQSVLQDTHEISCVNSRDLNLNTSKYWAQIGWVIDQLLIK